MIFILEGPDGSGKTTLASKLSEAFNFPVKHFSYPKTEEEQKALFETYQQYLLTHDNVIIDRMWLSTMVYGPVMRGVSEVSTDQATLLEKAFGHKIIMIYCTGDPQILWERCSKRGEDYVQTLGKFRDICRRYDEVMLTTKHYIPIHTWTFKEANNELANN